MHSYKLQYHRALCSYRMDAADCTSAFYAGRARMIEALDCASAPREIAERPEMRHSTTLRRVVSVDFAKASLRHKSQLPIL